VSVIVQAHNLMVRVICTLMIFGYIVLHLRNSDGAPLLLCVVAT
jgi:hypothetical protein